MKMDLADILTLIPNYMLDDDAYFNNGLIAGPICACVIILFWGYALHLLRQGRLQGHEGAAIDKAACLILLSFPSCFLALWVLWPVYLLTAWILRTIF